jgi:hypothetical protein
MVKRDSSLQRTHFHYSRVQWRKLTITPADAWHAHGDIRLVCGLSPVETHFMKLPTNSSYADVASRGSLAEAVMSVATEDRLFLCATHFSTQRSHSVSLCGLPFRGWAVIAPRCFHFRITALTVDWGSSSRTNWLVGKVASYGGTTFKVIELFTKDILLTMYDYGDCMAVCSISIYLSAMGVAEIAKSTNLKGCQHTFVDTS